MANVGFFQAIGRDLSGRGIFGGSFQLRLILQPLLALLLGVRFGIRDAKAGKRAFFLTMVTDKKERWPSLKQGLRDAIVPLCIAFLTDGILQRMINGHIRPMAAVVVGALLVFLPFMIGRGASNRIWTSGHGRRVPHAP
jgi:hypothetical protein